MDKPRPITIAPKEREEWEKLITKSINHRFINFVLQMHNADIREKIASKEITPEQAIDEMYEICEKYALSVQSDLKQVFEENIAKKACIHDNKLMDVKSVKELIKQGRFLILSGDESLLNQLPKGNWIGGTIPYFYLQGEKGRMEKNMIFVADFSDVIKDNQIITYDKYNLENICKHSYKNGFSFLILPAFRDIHLSFALNSPNYESLFSNPLYGLIAGVDLDECERGKPSKTYNGFLGENYTEKGVVMHCMLPPDKVARAEIVNVFEPSNETIIEVKEDTTKVRDCLINGKPDNLYDYIKTNNIDTRYPLVCDYAGATVNVAFQSLNHSNREIKFYAPLFKGKRYTLSKQFDSYVDTFAQKIKDIIYKEDYILYNCNCVHNYLYGELYEKDIGFSGPTTFGEIAYNLLNQTFTYLAIDEI